jgi:hypothetical protein
MLGDGGPETHSGYRASLVAEALGAVLPGAFRAGTLRSSQRCTAYCDGRDLALAKFLATASCHSFGTRHSSKASASTFILRFGCMVGRVYEGLEALAPLWCVWRRGPKNRNSVAFPRVHTALQRIRRRRTHI